MSKVCHTLMLTGRNYSEKILCNIYERYLVTRFSIIQMITYRKLDKNIIREFIFENSIECKNFSAHRLSFRFSKPYTCSSSFLWKASLYKLIKNNISIIELRVNIT